MTTFIQEKAVVRPTPAPLTSTLLHHFPIHEMSGGFGMRNESGMWPSYNCMDTLVPTPLCPAPLVDEETREPKVFAEVEWVPGFSFAVYGATQCKAIGLDEADQKAETERVFLRNQSKGVERALLWNRFLAREDADLDGQLGMNGVDVDWDAPVDLTNDIGTSIPLVVALAQLEGYAAEVYSGQPTIHMARAAATVLEASGLIVWQGDKAFTKNGSKVAMGGGYDSRTYVSNPGWSLFATGEVYVEASPKIVVNQHVIPGDNALAVGALEDNTVVSLAERAFRVSVDCFVAKATGTVWS